MNGVLGHLSTCRLNWAGITCWGWWDEWDDTAPQTQNSKFEPWRSEAGYATSRARRLPTIFNLYEWTGKKQFVSLKLQGQSGVRARDVRLSKHQGRPVKPITAVSSHIVNGAIIVLVPLNCFFLCIFNKPFQRGDRLWTSESNVYIRHILTSKEWNIYNGRRPIIWVFKRSRKSWLKCKTH